MKNFWNKVKKTKTCWEWTGALNNMGYGKFSRRPENWKLAHRISWILKYGKIRKGRLILHKCDNPKCVRPSHLFAGNFRDNSKDMIRKGRQSKIRAYGENHPRAIFKDSEALAIREMRKFGWSNGQMSEMLSVSKSAIKHIVKRRVYKHI